MVKMIKNKYIVLLCLSLAILSSCTMKENIQRDLILQTTPIAFNIPITTKVAAPVTLAEISTEADLNTLISEHANGFTAADLQSIQVTGFLLEIEGNDSEEPGEGEVPGEGEEPGEPAEPDLTNTFKAFQSIRVQLRKPDNTLLDIGVINNANMQSGSSILIPITTPIELKDQLVNNAFTYVVTGTAINPTTAIIKAGATIQYKLKLGM